MDDNIHDDLYYENLELKREMKRLREDMDRVRSNPVPPPQPGPAPSEVMAMMFRMIQEERKSNAALQKEMMRRQDPIHQLKTLMPIVDMMTPEPAEKEEPTSVLENIIDTVGPLIAAKSGITGGDFDFDDEAGGEVGFEESAYTQTAQGDPGDGYAQSSTGDMELPEAAD